MNRRVTAFTFSISLLLIACAVQGCGSGEVAADLRVEDLEYRLLPGGARIVNGTVHNDGRRKINAVQVQISLFDDKNRRVDGMYAVATNLPAGGSATFREPVVSDLPINGARVKSIIVVN